MTRWLFLLLTALCAARLSPAQDVAGNWVGSLPRSVNGRLLRSGGLPWIVSLAKDHQGEWTGRMWQPGQATVTYQFKSVTLTGSKLAFTVQLGGGSMYFVGVVSADGKTIDGSLQGLPMKLERSGHTTKSKAFPPATSTTPAAPSLETATVTAAAAQSDAVLQRALARLAGTSERLLKYTCLETIERTYYSEPAGKPGAHPMTELPADSCAGREFSEGGRLAVDADDRLRLEVAVADGKEIHSWASATRFDSRSVFDLIPTGPMSTGAFGSALVDIFENPGARYTFKTRKNEDSREVFEYAFEVPLAASHSKVRAGRDWTTTGYRGWFDVDAATAETLRVFSETDPLIPETRMCRNRGLTSYHYVPVGDGQLLIPIQSGFDVLYPDGNETKSVTTFSACHEYTAESSVAYEQEAPEIAARAGSKTGERLPPGIQLTLVLLQPIDAATAAAGDAVTARVAKAVSAPGSNQMLVEEGAIVHGRITQVRHQYKSARFELAIRYETLEQRLTVSPLSIELERDVKAADLHNRQTLATRATEFSLPAPAAADESGSWFSAPAASGSVVLRAGSESKWTTVAK